MKFDETLDTDLIFSTLSLLRRITISARLSGLDKIITLLVCNSFRRFSYSVITIPCVHDLVSLYW